MCRLCEYLRLTASSEYLAKERRFYDSVENWEVEKSGGWEVYEPDNKPISKKMDEAYALLDGDRVAARTMFLDLANLGSVWSMYMTGWFYEFSADNWHDEEQALTWYHKAVCGGSWTATLAYAALLEKRGNFEDADAVLMDGVNVGFMPAVYRLAKLRYENSPSRATAQSVRHLLDSAISEGHPAAEVYLGRLMLLGKFGLRRIPEGWRRISAGFDKFSEHLDQAAAKEFSPAK